MVEPENLEINRLKPTRVTTNNSLIKYLYISVGESGVFITYFPASGTNSIQQEWYKDPNTAFEEAIKDISEVLKNGN